MTENEAINNINALNAVCWDKDFYDEEFAKAMAKAVKTLHEIQQYRAIGTVEEFKALKENERKCKDCAGCTNWMCDCANERANAIDDFVERITLPLTEEDIARIVEELKGGAV